MKPDRHPEGIFVHEIHLGADGLRVGIKDSIDIAGYPTRAGSAALADAPPAARHADVVQALLDGGCRVVGKTTLHELAYGVTGINPWGGTPLNPRFPDRVPGGSSSGSAVAVAAERVDFAIGTDTGGSIRLPAACCGIYGLKPTYGRICRVGIHPPTSSLDCVGPFARDLDMLERAMALLDPTFTAETAPRQLRVARLRVDAEPTIDAAVDAALNAAAGIPGADHPTRSGATARDAGTAREAAPRDGATITLTSITLPSFEEAFAAGLDIIAAENWFAYGHLIESPALGADVRSRLLAARDITPTAVAAAERVRVTFRDEVDAALELVDVLALPTLPDVPLLLTAALDTRATLRSTALVRPFNVSGHPALTLPLLTEAGLPAGLQLVGHRHGDAALCAVAHRIVAAFQARA